MDIVSSTVNEMLEMSRNKTKEKDVPESPQFFFGSEAGRWGGCGFERFDQPQERVLVMLSRLLCDAKESEEYDGTDRNHPS